MEEKKKKTDDKVIAETQKENKELPGSKKEKTRVDSRDMSGAGNIYEDPDIMETIKLENWNREWAKEERRRNLLNRQDYR